jgi:hypothetical protein
MKRFLVTTAAVSLLAAGSAYAEDTCSVHKAE